MGWLTFTMMLFIRCELVLVTKYCVVENGTRINLHSQSLREVPQNLPFDTVELILTNNHLTALRSRGFSQMSQIQYLDLSHNAIAIIEENALWDLGVLCYLDLRANRLDFCDTTSYSVSLFKTVPLMKVLHVSSNRLFNCQYNDELFLPLRNLHDLSVDANQLGPSLMFGAQFSRLTSLETLCITASLQTFSELTFYPFEMTNIHTIIIMGSEYVEPRAFSMLRNITNIIIHRTSHLGLKAALMSLDGLEDRNMSSIVLSGVNADLPHDKKDIDNFILDRTIIKYLAKICVKVIDLSQNNIMLIDNVFKVRYFRYPECLLELNLSANNIMQVASFMHDICPIFPIHFFQFPNFRHVDTSLRNGIFQMWFSAGVKHEFEYDIMQKPYIDTFNCSYNRHISMYAVESTIIVKLTVFDMAYSAFSLDLFVNEHWSRLKVFNISGWKLTEMQLASFGFFPELEVLVARDVNLDLLEKNTHRAFFYVFPKLKLLDIAYNGISFLHQEQFADLPLEVLDISNNKLLFLSPAIRSLTSLKTLHLSYNSITKLDLVDRRWIEQMALPVGNDNKDFTITAHGNPFACVCKTFLFVQWLLETEAIENIVKSSSCYFENGTQISLLELKGEFSDFMVGCVSQFWLTFAISMGCVVAVGLALSIVCFRYRWNIKYWFLTKCRKNTEYEPIPGQDYPFDAFVAYNHENYDWACFRLRSVLEEGHQQYRLCLHHRDFPVGESIQQNIVDAVNSSRKIILVITRKYLSCDWGEFEIEMAGMRAVRDGNDSVIIAILLEEIPVRKMPRSLLNLWKHVTFLLWKDDPVDERIFWARLLDAMAR